MAGLTKFEHYKDHSISLHSESTEQFVAKAINDPMPLFFIQCLFEAQNSEYITSIFSRMLMKSHLICNWSRSYTSLDWYVFGYCIANFPINLKWTLELISQGYVIQSFVRGLKTCVPCVGVLGGLRIMFSSEIHTCAELVQFCPSLLISFHKTTDL